MCMRWYMSVWYSVAWTRARTVPLMNHPHNESLILILPCVTPAQFWVKVLGWAFMLDLEFSSISLIKCIQSSQHSGPISNFPPLPPPPTKYWSGNRVIKKVRNRTVNAGKIRIFPWEVNVLQMWGLDTRALEVHARKDYFQEVWWDTFVEEEIWHSSSEAEKCVTAGKEWGRKSFRKRRYKEK